MKHLLPIIIGLVAIFGMVDSTYLALMHFNIINPASTETSGICTLRAGQCERVVTSDQADIAGIPHAILGMAYFALILAAVSARLILHRWIAPYAMLDLLAVGLAFSVYLLYVLLYEIHIPCPFCLAAHGANLVIVGLSLLSLRLDKIRDMNGARASRV